MTQTVVPPAAGGGYTLGPHVFANLLDMVTSNGALLQRTLSPARPDALMDMPGLLASRAAFKAWAGPWWDGTASLASSVWTAPTPSVPAPAPGGWTPASAPAPTPAPWTPGGGPEVWTPQTPAPAPAPPQPESYPEATQPVATAAVYVTVPATSFTDHAALVNAPAARSSGESAPLPAAAHQPSPQSAVTVDPESVQEDWGEPVPHWLRCPISLSLLRDPVVAADGHTYERALIEKWFGGTQPPYRSPVTQEPMRDGNLVPNHLVRVQAREWREAHERKGAEGGTA